MSDIPTTIGMMDCDLKTKHEFKLMKQNNEILMQKYKEVKKELKGISNSFENDKQQINKQMLEVMYGSKKNNNEENGKLKKHIDDLESSLKNIANNYVLIEKQVWKDQFNGNLDNMNMLVHKICDLEHNIRILESELIEKEEFYKNELVILRV